MAAHDSTFLLGDRRVRIVGAHPLVTRVHRELAPAAMQTASPDVVIEVVDGRITPAAPSVRLGEVATSPGSAWIEFRTHGLQTCWQPGAPLRISVSVEPFPVRYPIPRRLYRWANPTFLSPDEAQAYAFVNGLLETVLLWCGDTTVLVHAAAVERDGRAVLLASAGGVGKTTTSARMLASDRGWRYLSDDIALLGAAGATLHPRWLMAYAYNLEDPEFRHRFLETTSLADRLHWFLHTAIRDRRRRRRVEPARFYGARSVSGGAPTIDGAFFLARTGEGSVRLEPMSAQAFADACTAILDTEYQAPLRLLRLWEALGGAPTTVEGVLARHRQHIARRLESARIVGRLLVPDGTPPGQVARFVDELVPRG